jgi:hypothetical protein
MRTGDFRGAGPFAVEWILAEGRQVVPAGHAPRLLPLFVMEADADESRFRLRERDGSDEAFIDAASPVEVER